MEPSQIFGGAEECHSSESGWTMYIGSPTDDDGHSGEDRDNDNSNDKGIQADPEDESDDSMASDASSRPWGSGQGGHGLADSHQVAEEQNDDKKYYCLDKSGNKIQEKQIEGKRVEKKEKIVIDGKGKAPAQGNGKVRKNYLVGKTK